MELSEYIEDMSRRLALAKELGKNPDYLWQIATGRRRSGALLAMEIETATLCVVSRHKLRPDIFGDEPKKARK